MHNCQQSMLIISRPGVYYKRPYVHVSRESARNITVFKALEMLLGCIHELFTFITDIIYYSGEIYVARLWKNDSYS